MILRSGSKLIYVDLLGPETAQVVVLAHALAADGSMWAEQVPALLAKGWRVLRIDMRGHGGSEPVGGPATMERLADDICDGLGLLGIDQVHYVGLSIGGMIGLAFGLRHAARLRSLTICDALPASPVNGKALWAPRIEAVLQTGSTQVLADATIARWLGSEFKAANPMRWTQVFETVCGTSPQGFVSCAQAIQDFSFVDQLASIVTPTMVICGSDDPGAPPAASASIASGVPNATYREIPGAMHLPNIEQPDAFNAVLLPWLDANR